MNASSFLLLIMAKQVGLAADLEMVVGMWANGGERGGVTDWWLTGGAQC